MSALLQVSALKAAGMSQAVDFELQAQQLVMLYGASGTGKSVLMKALADLIPHEGRVWLNGAEQLSMCPETWRRQVMYFSTETAWWRETVEEHFERLPDETQLTEVDLDPRYLRRSVNSLSSGEKQRLALLRGLLYEPRVLLLDEITANLDPDNTAKVEEMLERYRCRNHAAVFWVSHDEGQKNRLAEPQNRWDIKDLYCQETSL